MKRALFGTTALVAASALVSATAQAEEGIKLGLGGYMNNYFGVGTHDSDTDTDFNATNLFTDGEVWFLGETTLDNGITFGANIQLESFTTGDQIDENFGYISGSFGRLNIGGENSAAYLMQFAAPNVGVPINSGWVSTFVPVDGALTAAPAFRTPQLSTFIDIGNDEHVVSYFSPRFAGFQVGATYIPTVAGTGEGSNVVADRDTQFHNGISIGANYVNSLGPVDLAVAGGYRYATAPDNPGSGGNQAGNNDDLIQYSAGINVGFSGVTVGGSIAVEDSGRNTDGWSFDAGASYGRGPWAVGATYLQSEVEGTAGAAGDDELMAFEVGASYAVGPGITASASVLYAEWEGGGGLEADGIVGVVGLNYKF